MHQQVHGRRPMRVSVIGGGLMGSGISEVCARAGLDVTVTESDDDPAEAPQARSERSLERGRRAGKIDDADAKAAGGRIAYTATLEDAAGPDAATEAIIEYEPAKRDVFR